MLLGVAAGVALLFGAGPLLHWATDGRVIKQLAKLDCPLCGEPVGLATATMAAELSSRENSGIAMVNSGYTPSSYAGSWNLECDRCRAPLRFLIRHRKLVERQTPAGE